MAASAPGGAIFANEGADVGVSKMSGLPRRCTPANKTDYQFRKRARAGRGGSKLTAARSIRHRAACARRRREQSDVATQSSIRFTTHILGERDVKRHNVHRHTRYADSYGAMTSIGAGRIKTRQCLTTRDYARDSDVAQLHVNTRRQLVSKLDVSRSLVPVRRTRAAGRNTRRRRYRGSRGVAVSPGRFMSAHLTAGAGSHGTRWKYEPSSPY